MNRDIACRPPRFWVRWLLAASALVILFGMVMVIAPGLTRRGFSLLVFGSPGHIDRFGVEAAGYVSLAHAVIGGVLVGWGCALFQVSRTLFAQGSRDAWALVAVSVGAWFVVDTSYSVWSGYWQNALLNAGFLMLFVPPLWATRGMGRQVQARSRPREEGRMPALVYQHAESTRRPVVAAAALLGAAITWVGWSYGAPPGLLAVALFSTLFAAGFFVLGRRSGSRIDREELFFFAGRWEKRIPIADVSGYRRTPWTESQDWIHLRGRDEDEWLVPVYCVGDVGRFTAALDTLGVPREA